MGKCMKDPLKIQEYLDKNLDTKKKGLLYLDLVMEKHLAECEICKEKWQEEQQLFEGLAGLKSYEPPGDFIAQLMQRVALTENYPARQPLPLWIILVSVFLAFMATLSLAVSGLWLWGNEKVFSYLQALTSPFLDQAWLVISVIVDFGSRIFSVISGLTQIIRVIVETFPITGFLIILLPIVTFALLVKLINSFQSENYA
jgi:predicted anti-sigma-YlaC factor YlaD